MLFIEVGFNFISKGGESRKVPDSDSMAFAVHRQHFSNNQHKEFLVAYENGVKIFTFQVITGDDETTTNPGIYPVKLKDPDYYSKKFDTPMPYSIFFDLKERKAIHGGEVPPPIQRVNWATHGCVHVEMPYIKQLYDWVEVGKTVVVVEGWRDED